jgi:hypothetical protein
MSVSTQNPTLHDILEARIQKEYPVIFGVPGSWAAISEMVDAFWESVPSVPIQAPTLAKLDNIQTSKKRKNKNRDVGWIDVEKPKKEKNNTKKKTYGNSRDTLALTNLPSQNVSSVKLEKIFKEYGSIQKITICKSVTFVKFHSISECRRALNAIPTFIYNMKTVYVKYA